MPSIGRYFKFPGTLLVILTCSTFPTVTLEWWHCIRLCWKSETVRGIAHFPTIRPIRILTICSYVPFFLPSTTTEKDDFLISKTSFTPCPLNPIFICFLKALLSQLSTLLSLLYYFHYYKNYVFMIKNIHRRDTFLISVFISYAVLNLVFLPLPPLQLLSQNHKHIPCHKPIGHSSVSFYSIFEIICQCWPVFTWNMIHSWLLWHNTLLIISLNM